MKYIKASNPVELSEYVVANNIEYEPVFKWWVKDVFRKQDQIISKFKAKYWRTTHKFVIHVPKTVDEALKLISKQVMPFGKNQLKSKWLTSVSISRF